MDFPPFHPEWLVTLWLTTPGINKLDPHLSLIAVFVIIAVIYFLKTKQRKGSEQDEEEARFQYLVRKKTMLEEELFETKIECEEGNLSNDVFLNKKAELEKHLERTKTELQQYIV